MNDVEIDLVKYGRLIQSVEALTKELTKVDGRLEKMEARLMLVFGALIFMLGLMVVTQPQVLAIVKAIL